MFEGVEVRAKLTRRCPFCGCEKINATSPAFYTEKNLCCVIISCDECGAEIAGEPSYDHDYNEAARSAVKKWNGRAA